MTTAIIGTGGLGSVIARQQIGCAAVVAPTNRDALPGADAVVLALRFTVPGGRLVRSVSSRPAA